MLTKDSLIPDEQLEILSPEKILAGELEEGCVADRVLGAALTHAFLDGGLAPYETLTPEKAQALLYENGGEFKPLPYRRPKDKHLREASPGAKKFDELNKAGEFESLDKEQLIQFLKEKGITEGIDLETITGEIQQWLKTLEAKLKDKELIEYPELFWTDDTAMMLCLAMSVIEKRKFDLDDIYQKFQAWCFDGYMMPEGYQTMGTGGGTRTRLAHERRPDEDLNGQEPFEMANGSLMRNFGIVLAYFGDTKSLKEFARLQGYITNHNNSIAGDCCVAHALAVSNIIEGMSKEEALKKISEELDGEISEEVLEILRTDYKDFDMKAWFEETAQKFSDDSDGKFDLARSKVMISMTSPMTLRIALWALDNSHDLRSLAEKIIKFGYDTDTYGAVAGDFFGALHGIQGIPEEWRRKIVEVERIIKITVDTLKFHDEQAMAVIQDS